jgi:hypothetical protein
MKIALAITEQLTRIRSYFAGCKSEFVRGRSFRKNLDPNRYGVLERFLARNHWPNTGDLILLVHDTSLSRLQIDSWFKNRRIELELAGQLQDKPSRDHGKRAGCARKLWTAYRSAPERVSTCLRDGTLCRETGLVKEWDATQNVLDDTDPVETREKAKDAEVEIANKADGGHRQYTERSSAQLDLEQLLSFQLPPSLLRSKPGLEHEPIDKFQLGSEMGESESRSEPQPMDGFNWVDWDTLHGPDWPYNDEGTLTSARFFLN